MLSASDSDQISSSHSGWNAAAMRRAIPIMRIDTVATRSQLIRGERCMRNYRTRKYCKTPTRRVSGFGFGSFLWGQLLRRCESLFALRDFGLTDCDRVSEVMLNLCRIGLCRNVLQEDVRPLWQVLGQLRADLCIVDQLPVDIQFTAIFRVMTTTNLYHNPGNMDVTDDVVVFLNHLDEIFPHHANVVDVKNKQKILAPNRSDHVCNDLSSVIAEVSGMTFPRCFFTFRVQHFDHESDTEALRFLDQTFLSASADHCVSFDNPLTLDSPIFLRVKPGKDQNVLDASFSRSIKSGIDGSVRPLSRFGIVESRHERCDGLALGSFNPHVRQDTTQTHSCIFCCVPLAKGHQIQIEVQLFGNTCQPCGVILCAKQPLAPLRESVTKMSIFHGLILLFLRNSGNCQRFARSFHTSSAAAQQHTHDDAQHGHRESLHCKRPPV